MLKGTAALDRIRHSSSKYKLTIALNMPACIILLAARFILPKVSSPSIAMSRHTSHILHIEEWASRRAAFAAAATFAVLPQLSVCHEVKATTSCLFINIMAAFCNALRLPLSAK